MQNNNDKKQEKTSERDLPRLQKVLAASGVASRRACEALIAEGRVKVNGKVVLEQGTRVDPETDDIRVDGARIVTPGASKPIYIMLNKPVGYTSTVSDPHAERTVLELLLQVEERVYPVGRLDTDSEGMIILTNDGEFTNKLTHPRYHVPKLYRVRAKGFVGRAAATRLAEGIELEDGKTAPADVRFVEYDEGSQSTTVEITLYEGRNRQVRRMFDAVGNPVRQLTRIGFGNLRLGGLNPGTWRKLLPHEVEDLLALAKPTPTPPKAERKKRVFSPYRPAPLNKAPQKQEKQTKQVRPEQRDAAEEKSRFYPQNRPSDGAGTQTNGFSRPSLSSSLPRPSRGRADEDRPHQGAKPGRPPYGRPTGYNDLPPKEQIPIQSRPTRAATPFESKLAKIAKRNAQQSQDNSATNSQSANQRPNGGTKPQSLRPDVAARQEDPSRGSRPKSGSRNPKTGEMFIPPSPAPDGSTNSAAGRKAGIPYVPRPKPGFKKFGRARP